MFVSKWAPYDETEFVDAYLEAALWSECDGDGEPLHGVDEGDIAPASRADAVDDCLDFIAANRQDLDGLDPAQAGHDFLLTRNGHGAGFWDRGLGDKGDRLTDASHEYGETTFYVGDDGLIHVS